MIIYYWVWKREYALYEYNEENLYKYNSVNRFKNPFKNRRQSLESSALFNSL